MSHFVYVIYSEQADRYYVGESSDVTRRVEWHNTHEFEDASTKNFSDWDLRWSLQCLNIEQARVIENLLSR